MSRIAQDRGIAGRRPGDAAMMLKERRLRTVADAGGLVLRANPGFLDRPAKVGDPADHVVARIVDQPGIDRSLVSWWGEDPESSGKPGP